MHKFVLNVHVFYLKNGYHLYEKKAKMTPQSLSEMQTKQPYELPVVSCHVIIK